MCSSQRCEDLSTRTLCIERGLTRAREVAVNGTLLTPVIHCRSWLAIEKVVGQRKLIQSSPILDDSWRLGTNFVLLRLQPCLRIGNRHIYHRKVLNGPKLIDWIRECKRRGRPNATIRIGTNVVYGTLRNSNSAEFIGSNSARDAWNSSLYVNQD